MSAKVITVSREFGSGGREIGRQLAEALGFKYYDKEIISAIASENALDENYVSHVLEKGLSGSFPLTYGRTLTYPSYIQSSTTKILVSQRRIIERLPKYGDCVIVGRSANAILRELYPLRIFVCAEMSAKLRRCRERAESDEKNLSDNALKRRIRQIDAERARQHEITSGEKWGAKENYDLCINTTNIDITKIVSLIANYVK